MSLVRTGQSYHIREAREEDMAAVSAVIISSMLDTYQDLTLEQKENIRTGYAPEVVAGFVGNESYQALVAETPEKEIVGFAALKLSPSKIYSEYKEHFEREPDGWLFSLFTTKKHQRSGVGSQLFYVGAKVLQEKGRSAVGWLVRASGNPTAIKYYEGLGAEYVKDESGQKIQSPDFDEAGKQDHTRHLFEIKLETLLEQLENKLSARRIDSKELNDVSARPAEERPVR